jgi:hypothetical protein
MLKAIVVALTLATPVIAGQQPSSVSPAARLGAPSQTQPAKPYKNLFKPTTVLPPVAAQSVAGDPLRPTVVCGMTVIPANPEIDPKMGITPKKSDSTRYTIRAINPPVCAIAPPAR